MTRSRSGRFGSPANGEPEQPDRSIDAPGHPEDSPGDPESAARTICLRLLTNKPRTRTQLAEALARRGIPEDAARRVLDRFTDVGLINDKLFAEAWVDSRHHGRGLARGALAAELRKRGVDGSTVEAAVDALDSQTEEQTARALVLRRLNSTRNLEPAVRMRRLVGMLARKGYPPGTAYRVVREVLEENGSSLDDEAGLDPMEPFDD